MKYFILCSIVMLYVEIGTADEYEIQWIDTIYGRSNSAAGVAVDIDGNIVVTGTICPGLSTEYDVLTVKYDSEGKIMWMDTLRGSDQYIGEQARGVAVDTAGNIVIGGGIYFPGIGQDFFVVKYNSSGNILWTDTLDYTFGDGFSDVAIDNFGNILLAGGYSSYVFPYSNYFTCKYKPIQGVEEKDDDKLFCSFNTPNPFVRFTNIRYRISDKSKVSLKIYDISGRCAKTLIDEEKDVGHYKVRWDGEEFPTGIYFAKFSIGNYKATKKLILIR